MTAPLVSIILPTYNDRNYLPATIASALAQRYENFEVILVDDGSRDGSEAIYRALAAQDARLRCLRQENQGLSAARNAGLALARGELIAFLDSDDLLHPEFLARLVALQQAEDADLVVCDSAVFPDGQTPPLDQLAAAGAEPMRRLDGVEALRALLRGEIITNVWNRLYRRALLDGVTFTPGILHEDLEFTARLLLRTRRVVCLPLALHAYRKRAGSILSTPKPQLLEDRLLVVRKVYATLAEAGLAARLAVDLQAMAAKHLGYYGMKDMVRSPVPDWDWFARMRRCLREECGVRLGDLDALPLPGQARKWVRLALLPLPVGRAFLGYQHWRARR
jgi:glycosyltransferase involved in cell wall biosynthesis